MKAVGGQEHFEKMFTSNAPLCAKLNASFRSIEVDYAKFCFRDLDSFWLNFQVELTLIIQLDEFGFLGIT